MSILIHLALNTVSLDAEEIDLQALMNVIVEKVAKPRKNEGPIFLQLCLSRISPGFRLSLKETGRWIRIREVIQNPFSQDQADRNAIETAKSIGANIICIRVIPDGLISKYERDRLIDKLRDDWGVAYLYEMPKEIPLAMQ